MVLRKAYLANDILGNICGGDSCSDRECDEIDNLENIDFGYVFP